MWQEKETLKVYYIYWLLPSSLSPPHKKISSLVICQCDNKQHAGEHTHALIIVIIS